MHDTTTTYSHVSAPNAERISPCIQTPSTCIRQYLPLMVVSILLIALDPGTVFHPIVMKNTTEPLGVHIMPGKGGELPSP